MSRNKYGQPRARFGQVKIQYGYSRHDGEDLFMCYGGHLGGKQTSRLIMSAINSKQYSLISGSYESSLLEELESRGYDTKTLKFSIEMHPDKLEADEASS